MLAIFDMSSVNVERYNSELLKRYTGQYTAYVDDPDCCDYLSRPEATLVCTGGWSIKKIIENLKEQNISVIIISGQRPADYRVLLAANALKIPIIYKMHGLYVADVKRNISFYFRSIKKVLRTIRYLIDIGRYTRSASVPIGIFLSFVFGVSRKAWVTKANEALQVDHCLVWSEYWKPWHELHWCMNPRKGWTVIGNPDTEKYKTDQAEPKDVCYIYQTLVEDGRISKQTMESFYDGLAAIAKKKDINVSVKWHTRGDTLVRRGLESRGFYVEDELPLSKVYIGHFSSLLGLVPLVDGVLVIFELEGHVTPKPISECATVIVYNMDELGEALSVPYSVDEDKKIQAEYYFGTYYSPIVEYATVSEYLHA